MKKLILLFILFGSIWSDKKTVAQSISQMFNAQNYWMPNRTPFTGQLQTYWSDIVASGVKYMRVGGIAYDANATGHHVCGHRLNWLQVQVLLLLKSDRIILSR